MKYLKWDRPPVPPCTADLMRYFYPDRGYMTDVGGIVRLMNKDGSLDEEGFTTTEDEWETVLQFMNEEWEEEKIRNDALGWEGVASQKNSLRLYLRLYSVASHFEI